MELTMGVIITLLWSLPSIILYIPLLWTILHSSSLSTDFRSIFIFTGVMNLITFFNKLFNMTIPQELYTIPGVIEFYTSLPIWIAKTVHFIGNYMFFVQFLCISVLTFNRFTCILFPFVGLNHSKFWNRIGYYFIAILVFPLLIYRFYWDLSFKYMVTAAGYPQNKSPDSNPDGIYNTQILVGSVLSISTLIFNVISLILVSRMKMNKNGELGLLLYAVCNFLLMAALTLSVTFFTYWPTFFITFIPLASDGITFNDPYILLFVSKKLRNEFIHQYCPFIAKRYIKNHSFVTTVKTISHSGGSLSRQNHSTA